MILSLNLNPQQCLPDKVVEISEDVICQSDPHFNAQWTKEDTYYDKESEAILPT